MIGDRITFDSWVFDGKPMVMQIFLRVLTLFGVGTLGAFLVFLTFPLLKVKKSDHRAFYTGRVNRGFSADPFVDPESLGQHPGSPHFAPVLRQNK
jgi:hypothetical protein